MKEGSPMIAACGLDCGPCDIREATDNADVAQEIADWFKKERNEDIKAEDIYCQGCKGERERHWSADCWILNCCVDEKGLEYCYECGDFPCPKLEDWAKGSERYGEALNRLKEMKEK